MASAFERSGMSTFEAMNLGGGAGPRQETEFMSKAREYARESDCSMTEAMSKLARGSNGHGNSPLFDRHLETCAADAHAHAERKTQAGVS